MADRQTAVKIRVKDLLNVSIIPKTGWDLNYFEFNNKQVSKINLIALIVNIGKEQLVVDDGTGSIIVRTFKPFPSNIEVGKSVLIIGGLRELDSERFVVGEILKILDNKDWLKVRKLELENIKSPEKQIFEKVEIKKESLENSHEKILNTVRSLDNGEGVDVEEIIKKTNIHNCESKINNLLMEGELFEIKQGKVKILR